MRFFEPSLWQTGESSIADVILDPTSRDDIPQLLFGLQYLYSTPWVRTEVLQILDEVLPEEIDRTTGRPGMVLWRILVMGVLRLNLNWESALNRTNRFAKSGKNSTRRPFDMEFPVRHYLTTRPDCPL